MTICKKCGAEVDASAKFCDKCGTKLEVEPETTTSSNVSAAATDLPQDAASPVRTITLRRKKQWIGCAVALYISVDGKVVGKVKSGKDFSFSVPKEKDAVVEIGVARTWKGTINASQITTDLVQFGFSFRFSFGPVFPPYLEDSNNAKLPLVVQISLMELFISVFASVIIIPLIALLFMYEPEFSVDIPYFEPLFIVIGILLGLTIFMLAKECGRPKIDAVRTKIKQKKGLVIALASVLLLLSLVPVFGTKTQYYTLESFTDYTQCSAVSFKDTEYSNSWFLGDASDYKTVIRDFRQIFGHENYYTHITLKNEPGPYQAKFAFFKSDDGKNYEIVLQVGNKIKASDNVWNWVVPISGFSDGSYVLKCRLWRWEKTAEEKYLDMLKSLSGSGR